MALVLLLLAVFSLKTHAQEIQEYSDPYQLMSTVVQRARENDKMKSELLTFGRTDTVQELDQTGKPKPTKPNFPETIPQGKGRKNEPLKLDINRVLDTSYYFRFDENKVQMLKGELVYVIHFWPKNRLANGENGYYKAANRASGTIYINRDYLYVRRLEAVMNEPFNVYGGFGRLRTAELIFEQSLRTDLKSIVVIDFFTAIVRYRLLFSEKHENHTFHYDNYQLAN